MLVAEMFKRDLSIAEAKAWSQNLGHSKPLMTLSAYGQIPVEEQGRLIRQGKVGGAQRIDEDRIVERVVEEFVRRTKEA